MADFSTRKPGFNPRAAHMRLVVKKVALAWEILSVLQLNTVNTIQFIITHLQPTLCACSPDHGTPTTADCYEALINNQNMKKDKDLKTNKKQSTCIC
jgi:hypothetical protein